LASRLFTYYFSGNRLEKYPFHLDFSWGLFLLAGLLIMLISALTISYNTVVIARTNPAETVKYE
jgi:putative ABC transport system permease protein